MSLLTELKRRNVFRVAAAYAVVAWLTIEVADTVFPRLGLPDWTVTFIIAALIIGLPVAVVLAWAFELTPEGVRRERPAASAEPVPRRTGKRIDRLIIVALIIVIALMAAERIWLAERDDPAVPARTVEDVAPGGEPTAVDPGAEKSVAVLPFVNMSSDPENEYFADGISEEILNLLTGLKGLRVAGRTSSFQFKGQGEDLRRIGDRLGVTHILEGSVRKSGDRVRITAQLIQAEDGFHVWSETYDRELTDIFAVQDEIAGAILESMKVSLLGNGPDRHIATTGMEAYSHYLKAQSALARRGTENLRAAREGFESALALDPDYVPAMVGLARTLALMPVYARLGGGATEEMTGSAVRLARRALELDPDNAHAHAVLGTVFTFYEWRWEAAEEAFARALALAPNDPEIVNFAGDYYRVILDTARALATERRALELDPLHAVNHWDLAWSHVAFGDHENAIAYAKSANALAPEAIDPYDVMVWSYGALGRLDEMEAARVAARRNTHEAEPEYLLLDVWAAIARGDREEALRLQEKIEPYAEAGEYSNAYLGYQYLLLGEPESAAEWLERAYEHRDTQLVFDEPFRLELIGRDPRNRAILERPGLRELLEIREGIARPRARRSGQGDHAREDVDLSEFTRMTATGCGCFVARPAPRRGD